MHRPSVRKLLTARLRHLLKTRGYVLSRFPAAQQAPADVRHSGNDPRAVIYVGRPALIEAPVDRGRGLHNFPLRRCGPHPFVRAAAAAAGLKQPDAQREAIRDLLSAYYQRVQPHSFAAWMALPMDDSLLTEIPPWAGPFPWEPRGVAATRRDRAAAALADSRRRGVDLPISAGWQFVGPASPDKIALEVERLRTLVVSMQQSGYRRSDARTGDVSATVLWRDDPGDPWRWIVHDGHHRAAVAAAVGLDTIPLRVVRVVRRDEAAIWPNVVENLYPIGTALEIFDRQFSEQPPPAVHRWLEYLSEAPPPGYNPRAQPCST